MAEFKGMRSLLKEIFPDKSPLYVECKECCLMVEFEADDFEEDDVFQCPCCGEFYTPRMLADQAGLTMYAITMRNLAAEQLAEQVQAEEDELKAQYDEGHPMGWDEVDAMEAAGEFNDDDGWDDDDDDDYEGWDEEDGDEFWC